jgi:hypothetical protein
MSVKCPHCSEPVEGWIPKERFDTKSQALREAEAKATALEASAGDSAKLAEALAASKLEVKAARDALATHQAESGTSESIYRAGITDPDDLDQVLYQYGRLGDDAPELSAWLGDGAKANKYLAPLFATPQATEPATDAPVVDMPAATPAPSHAPNSGVAPAPPPVSPMTTAQHDALVAKFRRGGISKAEFQEKSDEWFRSGA